MAHPDRKPDHNRQMLSFSVGFLLVLGGIWLIKWLDEALNERWVQQYQQQEQGTLRPEPHWAG